MRLSLVSVVPAGVLASLVLLAGSARAHLSLTSPPPRSDLQKQGPCGGGPDQTRGETKATFKPGETIVVTWNEFVDHPGHYRIALDPDGQDDFFEPKAFDDVSGGPGVLMDGIADKNGGDYSQEITLPNIECDSCVLQVIQMMTDKKPYGDGNDLYYQCADIAIVGEMVGTTGEPGSTGSDTTIDPATSGASDPSAGETGTAGEPGSTGGGETAAGNTGGDDPTTGPATGDASTGDGGTGTSGATGDASSSSSGGTSDGASEGSGCGCRGDADGSGAGWLALGLLSVLVRRRRA